jgi:hypothetical protein
MYGNTHLVARAIAEELRPAGEVVVVSVDGLTSRCWRALIIVVVGGPTHVQGMSRDSTRKAAVAAAQKPDANLELDADAEGPGLREWFDTLGGAAKGTAAARSTRASTRPRANRTRVEGHCERLGARAYDLIAEPRVSSSPRTAGSRTTRPKTPGEWGARLLAAVSGVAP